MANKDKLPIAVYGSEETYLEIGDHKIGAYVLDNGKRMLSHRGMLKALGMSSGTAGGKGADRLGSFISGDRIKQFVSNDLLARMETPEKFTANGTITHGYEAEILQQVVRTVAKAFLQGKLLKQQEHIGRNAEIMDDAFSKVGLIALIDEATGYQRDVNRARDELKQLLAKFILKEHAKWIKTFPDDFFEMIFRMKKWTWVGIARSKKPQVIGHYINDIVYSRLAPKILDELQNRNPTDSDGKRKTKHHQWLSPDMGHPRLKEHLIGVLALGRASGYNWNTFVKMLNKSYPKFGQTMEILFPEEHLIA